MPKLAKRASEIRPSPTMAMSARAAEMKRAGRDVIPLSLGEPDFHTPEHIKAAGIAAIQNDFTKYTASDGFGPLKKAIIDKLQRENGSVYSADQIVVGSGAKVIILAALLSIVNPNDEVIIPAPYWVTYPDHVELAGGKSVFVVGEESTGFKITPQALEGALSAKTRAIIFNSPSNPSGAVYTAAEISALAAVLKNYPDVWIVTDELYEHLVYDGQKTATFAQMAPELADRVITINGFSKGYVMTGWRLAFAAGPVTVMKSIGDLLSQITGSPNSIAQAAAIAALEGDQSFLAHNRQVFEERRNFVLARINQVAGLSAIKPAGTFYVYVNCGAWIGRTSAGGKFLTGDVDIVEALLDEKEMAAVPGDVFGLSPFFRISISLELPLLQKAMDRFDDFAEGLH
jgi:aspartate aminotransferase